MPDHNYISLQKASESVPFDSNYLGLLIRKGRLFGIKKRGKWYTTQEALDEYMENSSRVKIPDKKSKTKSFWSYIGLSGIFGASFFAVLVLFGTAVNAFFFEGTESKMVVSKEHTWLSDGTSPAVLGEGEMVSSKVAIRN